MNFIKLFENDFKLIFPELFLILSICIVLIYGVIYNVSLIYNKPLLINNMNWFSIQIILITILLIINNPIVNIIIFNKILIINNFTSILKILLLLSTIFCIFISFNYIKNEQLKYFEYPILILLSIFGMLLMISSYDLLTMYLSIELQSLCLYILATFKRNTQYSTEAGLKYFILGAFSSGILLFGFSIIYGFTGLTNFHDFYLIFVNLHFISNISYNAIIIGLIFIIVGLLFKLGAVPFHMWVPDVYEGAPTTTTAFFALVPKIAVLALFIRLFDFTFYNFIEQWQSILIICSISSMILATLGALYQMKLKRLIAYSAISHVGYILIGLITGTPEGIQGSIIYITIYIIMSINLFSILLNLSKESTQFINNNNYNNKSNNHYYNLNYNNAVIKNYTYFYNWKNIKYINDLNNLNQSNPLIAITLTIILFSIAGIPPLAGFFSKLYLFLIALESSMYFIAIIGVIMSVLAAVYYIRLIKIMYFEKISNINKFVVYNQINKETSIILGLTLIFILFFWINPSPLLILTHKISLLLSL